MPKQILEQATLVDSVDKKSGKILVDIITPGVGSSGYYSPEVCEAAAGLNLVTAGTQMFIDHPTDAEAMERPIRSVKDIAAVFTESARWDPNRGEAGSLVAEAQVVPAWVETMEVIQGAIGVSLRGSATDIVEGDVDGRRQRIVEGLHSVDSVDFVTRAGRGGSFALMESARPSQVHARAMGHGIAEATVNDTREALQTELRDAYAGDETYVWVRDFDETTVWFEVEGKDVSGIYGQTYTHTNGVITLTGDRTEVRVVTNYVPATRPDSTTETTEASQEGTMGKIQIEEAEHTRLLSEAGRVNELTTQLETATQRGDKAESDLATRDRLDEARKVIDDHDAVFTVLEARGLLADLPLTEAGELDVEAFTTSITEAAAIKAAANGAGQITGFGAPNAGTGEPVAESAPVKSAWGRPLTEQKGA